MRSRSRRPPLTVKLELIRSHISSQHKKKAQQNFYKARKFRKLRLRRQKTQKLKMSPERLSKKPMKAGLREKRNLRMMESKWKKMGRGQEKIIVYLKAKRKKKRRRKLMQGKISTRLKIQFRL
jgi:hypothetical protein